MKREPWKLERKSNTTGLHIDSEIYDLKSGEYSNHLLETKKAYYNNRILDCVKDQGALFNQVNKLLHKTTSFPPAFCEHTITKLASASINFFEGRVIEIHDHLVNTSNSNLETKYVWPNITAAAELATFSTIRPQDQDMIIAKSAIKSSSLDPLPAFLLLLYGNWA